MSGRFWKSLLIFLVALLLFGIVGIAISFAVRNSGMEFCVKYGNETYSSNMENQSIYLDTGTHDFTVKSLSDKQADYTVKVVVVADSNFVFTVNELIYQFCSSDEANNDYSEAFGLQQTEDGFTLTIAENLSVLQAVSNKYGGEASVETLLSADISYFALLVVSGDYSVYLPFSFNGQDYISTDGLYLDPPHIVF